MFARLSTVASLPIIVTVIVLCFPLSLVVATVDDAMSTNDGCEDNSDDDDDDGP